MPRRAAKSRDIGNLISIAVGALTLLAVLGGGARFYFATTTMLEAIPKALRDETAARETGYKQEVAAREAAHNDESEKREQLRSALLNYADKTQHSIDSLAANAMVQQEQIKNVNTNLDKVVQGLQNIELAVGRAKK